MEKVAGIDRRAELPKFNGQTFAMRAKSRAARHRIASAPAFGRKAALYATCFVNYNNPRIGEAARAVLAHNGVETEVVISRLLRHAPARAGRSRARGRQCEARGRGD